MATLIIRTATIGPPLRLRLELNGNGMTLEYPDRATMIADLSKAPDINDLDILLRFVLLEWKKTDTNFTNLAGLLNKTCTLTFNVTIT